VLPALLRPAATFGGAGAALPAFLTRERLTGFFVPLTAVFAGWIVQDFVVDRWFDVDPDFRQQSWLYWYDTDWLAALVAIMAVLVLALTRRRLDPASSLILHMAVGWWIGFLLLVVVLDWRMTPPRGDNWAGCLGMVAGMLVYFWRSRLSGEESIADIRNLFLFVGADPATGWLDGCGVTVDRGGFVVTGAQSEQNQGRPVPPLETSVPGVFAVGDVRSGSVKRVGGAIGEGAQVVAALHGFLGDMAKPAL